MKRLLLFIFLTALSLCVCARGIPVRSADPPSAPGWIHGSESGYVIASAQADDQQEARDRCFRNIQAEILHAVAVNISASSLYASQSYTADGDTQVQQLYQEDIRTAAASLPFLTGLTTANAEVWTEESEGGWRCYMKYPFPREDQDRLSAQFLAYDAEQNVRFARLQQELGTFTDIDWISAYIGEVETLRTYFFDAVRKSEAEGLKRQFLEASGRIAVTPVANEPGLFRYRLTLDGRTMTTSLVPQTRCETVDPIVYTAEEDGICRLEYSTQYCLPGDENKITLLYPFKYNKLKYFIHFNLSQK